MHLVNVFLLRPCVSDLAVDLFTLQLVLRVEDEDTDLAVIVFDFDRYVGALLVTGTSELPAALRVRPLVRGFDPNASDKRRWLLEQVLVGNGVTIAAGELQKDGSQEEVGALLLDVASAARGIADLIYLHRSQEPAEFDARVVAFLADHPVEVQPNVQVKGLSGHPYRLTARVLRPDHPPLLISTLSPRSKGQIKANVDRTVRQWVDVNGTVDRLQKVSFLNDAGVGWHASDLRLLDRLSIVTGWRLRHQITPVLQGTSAEPNFELALPLWEETSSEAGNDETEHE